MATDLRTTQNTSGPGSGNSVSASPEVVGQVLIVFGKVQAVSPLGIVRNLEPGGVVYLGERIVTGPDGAVTILFEDSVATRLDLGRGSEVLIDGELLGLDQGTDIDRFAGQVDEIQDLLQSSGEFDPTTDLPAPAAGGGAPSSAGGGHPVVRFELDGRTVTPTSGAETTGVTGNFVRYLPPEGVEEELEPGSSPSSPEPQVPVIEDTDPTAGDAVRTIGENNLFDGTEPFAGPTTVSGTLADIGVDFGPDTPGILAFDSGSIVIDANGDSLLVPGTYSTLVVNDDGTWSYTLNDNIAHPIAGATGNDDVLNDVFSFTAYDSDGLGSTGAGGSITIRILDDGPVATGLEVGRVVEEEALEFSPDTSDDPGYPTSPVANSQGNQDQFDRPGTDPDNPEDDTQPDSAIVSGSFASIVNVGADNPGSWGLLNLTPAQQQVLFSKGEQLQYRVEGGDTLVAFVPGKTPPPDDQEEELSPALQQFVVTDGPGEFGDRIVFTLEVQSNGDYTFTLVDQLDHVAPTGESIADENTQLRSGETPVEFLDFSAWVSVTDSDGDAINFAPGTIAFTMVDDVPELTDWTTTIRVEEEELDMPPNLSQGNDNNDLVGVSVYYGSLSHLVNVGADEISFPTSEIFRGPGFELLEDFSGLEAQNLTSKGVSLSYSVSGNTLTATADDGTEAREVFSFELQEDGGYVFRLNDQLDHDPPQGNTSDLPLSSLAGNVEGNGVAEPPAGPPLADQNTLQFDLSSVIRAYDYDGDKVDLSEGMVTLTVVDDIPEVITGAQVEGNVEESALSVHPRDIGRLELPQILYPFLAGLPDFSEGNSDSGSDRNNDVAFQFPLERPGHNSSGSLNDLVRDGADENVSFSLKTDSASLAKLPKLLVKGQPVHYYATNNVPGYPSVSGLVAVSSEYTPVFWLAISSDGRWMFDLDDQLDHTDVFDGTENVDDTQNFYLKVAPSEPDAGPGPRLAASVDPDAQSVPYIDFSAILRATDTDGDQVDFGPGQFFIRVEDDIPVAVIDPDPIAFTVEEDDLTGRRGGDTARGANEDGSKNGDEVSSDTENTIEHLFRVGADENPYRESSELRFGLIEDEKEIGEQLGHLTSGGLALEYSSDGTTLVASAGGREIFSLTVEEDGEWSFDLIGQLDHVPGGGENLVLAGAKDPGGALDFSGLLTATDFDNDTVTGAEAGSFIITIQDDEPYQKAPAQDAILVNEAGNSLVADLNVDPGSDGLHTVSITPLKMVEGQPVAVEDGDPIMENGSPLMIGQAEAYWHHNDDGSWSAMYDKPPSGPNNGRPGDQTPTPTVLFSVAPELVGGVFTGNYLVEQFEAFASSDSFFVSFRNRDGGTQSGQEQTFEDGTVRVVATGESSDDDSDPDDVVWSGQGLGVELDNLIDQPAGKESDHLDLNFTDETGQTLSLTQLTITVQGYNGISADPPPPPPPPEPPGDPDDQDGRGGGDPPPPPAPTDETGTLHWEAFSGGVSVGSGSLQIFSESGSQDLRIDSSQLGGSTFDEVRLDHERTADSPSDAGYSVVSVEGNYDLNEDHSFSFRATLEDMDEDRLTTDFDVTFDADGNVQGGEGPEAISGSSGDDILSGGGGDDVIYGRGGDDIIDGGSGSDTLSGGRGDDEISGGSGKDDIDGGKGDDELDGGRGADQISGGRGSDTITGGRGNDEISGGRGDDGIDGGPGEDTISGGRGDDTILGGPGSDTITGGPGSDTFDSSEEGAGEVVDYGPPEDDLDNLVPPITP